jgi:hypothetical protein
MVRRLPLPPCRPAPANIVRLPLVRSNTSSSNQCQCQCQCQSQRARARARANLIQLMQCTPALVLVAPLLLGTCPEPSSQCQCPIIKSNQKQTSIRKCCPVILANEIRTGRYPRPRTGTRPVALHPGRLFGGRQPASAAMASQKGKTEDFFLLGFDFFSQSNFSFVLARLGMLLVCVCSVSHAHTVSVSRAVPSSGNKILRTRMKRK